MLSNVVGIAVGLIAIRWLRSANRPLKEIDVIVQIGTKAVVVIDRCIVKVVDRWIVMLTDRWTVMVVDR